MSYLNKVAGAILGLEQAADIVGTSGVNVAVREYINAGISTLEGIRNELCFISDEKTVAVSHRDSLLLAIAGTNEGKTLDITYPIQAINPAIAIIRTMDADLRTNREAEEIPFGAVEQDHDKMQLVERVAELESQLEFKVDESAAIEKHLREYKAQWLSLINFINSISPDSLSLPKYLAAIDPAMPDSESTIFHRRYSAGDCGAGWITVRITTESMSHELKILPEFFNAVISGNKKAEIRKADRLFSVGDELWLREWTTQDGYTGRNIYRVITHITDIGGYAPGYVMLSIEPECKEAQK